MHQRIEDLALKLGEVMRKVKEGEDIIIENFQNVKKGFTKLQHDLKNNQEKPHFKEALKAAARVQGGREQ